jgi:two-component system cell cycle response regulator
MMKFHTIKQNFKVLVVADDIISRKSLERLLRNEGFKVVIAENGRVALEHLKEEYYPIVISDWMMPEMDGLELCGIIRQIKFEGYVYTILLTANSTKTDIIKGLKSGADDYLTKPFDRDELVARLSTATRILNLEKSLRKAHDEIQQLSITDPLTGAYNRRYFDEVIFKEAMRANRYHRQLSVVLCDLDHFKNINDTYGHQFGDEVLKQFVSLIKKIIRKDVDMVFRYGGEEFVVVLPEVSLKNAILLGERIRKTINDHNIFYENKNVKIAASFGVANYEDSITEPNIISQALINYSDMCLYECKRRGRNCVIGCRLRTRESDTVSEKRIEYVQSA